MVTAPRFSKREAIAFGWETAKANLGFFAAVLLIWLAVNAAPEFISGPNGLLGDRTRMPAGLASITFMIMIAYWVAQQIVGMGVVRISVIFAEGRKPGFEELFGAVPRFFPFLFASIVYALIVAAGLVLLVVPGIIWAIQFGLYCFLVIDKGMRPVEALRASSALTKGVRWELFLFGLLLLGINILGVLALVVGLFVTLPTSLLASAYVYRRLLEGSPPAAPEPIQA